MNKTVLFHSSNRHTIAVLPVDRTVKCNGPRSQLLVNKAFLIFLCQVLQLLL